MKKILVGIGLVLLIVSPVLAGRSTVVHTATTVGTTSVAVQAANNSRNFLLLQNDSENNDIYCQVGSTAVVNRGIRLNTGGGSILLDNTWPQGAVNCIATAANGRLLSTEGTGP